MAGEPQNLVLGLLREIRAEMAASRAETQQELTAVRHDLTGLSKKLDSLRQAVTGESVLGRYAAAEVEERLESVEKRLATLEKGAGKKPPTPRKPTT